MRVILSGGARSPGLSRPATGSGGAEATRMLATHEAHGLDACEGEHVLSQRSGKPREPNAVHRRWQHPWLQLEMLIRSIRHTTWDG